MGRRWHATGRGVGISRIGESIAIRRRGEGKMRNAFKSGNRKELPEMFHSEFLGTALRTSLNGDRSLFDELWKACAPEDWDCPKEAWVETEHGWSDARRIDILIGNAATKQVIGIEVKTKDGSVQPQQLDAYRRNLWNEYGEDNVAIVFLTPFNEPHADKFGERIARLLRAVEEFKTFSKGSKRVHHISWRDVANIPWTGGGDLWREHQAHVLETMASDNVLRNLRSRSRSLSEFFGVEPTEAFFRTLQAGETRDYKGGLVIDLQNYSASPPELANAVRILIKRGQGIRHRKKDPTFSGLLRRKFTDPDQCKYHEYHQALFDLEDEFEYVWLHGTGNYGLRVGHMCKSGSVSLVTSQGCNKLLIGQIR